MTSRSTSDVERLYDELVQSLYETPDPIRAQSVAGELRAALGTQQPGTIFVEDSESLIRESSGDLLGAIVHRKKVIELIRELHRVARGTDSWGDVQSQYGFEDLRDHLEALAMLYRENGDLDEAILTLQQSQRLCARHAIPYEAADLLDEYLEERRQSNTNLGFRITVSENGRFKVTTVETYLPGHVEIEKDQVRVYASNSAVSGWPGTAIG